MIIVEIPDFLKNVGKHILIAPALREYRELAKEINDYARVVKSSKNPQ